MKNLRSLIADALVEMLEHQHSFAKIMPKLKNKLSRADFALAQEILFGVARNLQTLEFIISQLLKKPINKAFVKACLLTGIYQLMFLRVAPHAVIFETVKAVKNSKFAGFSALTNAVLRNFTRQKENLIQKAKEQNLTEHPAWLVDLIKQDYENWQEIIQANNQRPPLWVRFDANKNIKKEYLIELQKYCLEFKENDLIPKSALLLQNSVDLTKLKAFQDGVISVQDAHAQWAGFLLDPQNDDLILDACAAPGGKTIHILELAPKANVIACDLDETRLIKLQENLTRTKHKAKVLTGCLATQAPFGENVLFDKILLDAPCSATGVIRRNPDIKHLRKKEDLANLVVIQQKMLNNLWQYLKVGGKMLYATCSILKMENIDQIENFLNSQPDAKLIDLKFNSPTKQFTPTNIGGDGFFYALLTKTNL